MLFSIKKENSSNISYLFGTMHAANSHAYTFYDQAIDCLNKCNLFAAEINFSDPRINEIGAIFSLPNGKSMLDYLTPIKYQKIRKQLLKSFGLDLENYKRMQPIFAINNFLSDVLPISHSEPLDQALYQHALAMQLKIGGLESIEDQYDIVAELDLETQFIQLKDLGRNPQKSRKKTINLMNYYAEGNIKVLYSLGRSALGKYRHTLLTKRNVTMANSMADSIASQTIFAAVGAGHLYGKSGMLKLLKDKGFLVKKLA